jgi:hypothetical protein
VNLNTMAAGIVIAIGFWAVLAFGLYLFLR